MANIKEASNGSLAKNGKLNEVIRYVNGLLNMTVREGSDTELPRLVSAENHSELVTTKGGGELPEGYVETDFIMCVNGAPVEGKILFKAD